MNSVFVFAVQTNALLFWHVVIGWNIQSTWLVHWIITTIKWLLWEPSSFPGTQLVSTSRLILVSCSPLFCSKVNSAKKDAILSSILSVFQDQQDICLNQTEYEMILSCLCVEILVECCCHCCSHWLRVWSVRVKIVHTLLILISTNAAFFSCSLAQKIEQRLDSNTSKSETLFFCVQCVGLQNQYQNFKNALNSAIFMLVQCCSSYK